MDSVEKKAPHIVTVRRYCVIHDLNTITFFFFFDSKINKINLICPFSNLSVNYPRLFSVLSNKQLRHQFSVAPLVVV